MPKHVTGMQTIFILLVPFHTHLIWDREHWTGTLYRRTITLHLLYNSSNYPRLSCPCPQKLILLVKHTEVSLNQSKIHVYWVFNMHLQRREVNTTQIMAHSTDSQISVSILLISRQLTVPLKKKLLHKINTNFEKLPSMPLYHMQTSHLETKNSTPMQIPYPKFKY